MRHEEWGEEYTTGTGQRLRVHKREDCQPYLNGRLCAVHVPLLQGWRTNWRKDRRHRNGHQSGVLEMLCPHNRGHVQGRDHGCDGCCRVLEVLEGEGEWKDGAGQQRVLSSGAAGWAGDGGRDGIAVWQGEA
jgi:hypothetical protein